MKWHIACVASLVAVAPAHADERAVSETCDQLNAETLAIIERRPVLKEELATGLMWMRLDAERARASGDAKRCIELLTQVKKLLS